MEESQVFSALKDKISSIASRGNTSTSVEQSIDKKDKIENMGELVPLLSSLTMQILKPKREKERIIPLYEEQLEINKEDGQSSRNSSYKTKSY